MHIIMNKTNILLLAAILANPAKSWIPQSQWRTNSILFSTPTKDELTSSLWQSHISTHPESKPALHKVLNEITGTQQPDLAFMFVSQAHSSKFNELVQLASSYFGPNTDLISVIGGGVIGDGRELDIPNQPGLSILTGVLPQGANVQVCNPHDSLEEDNDYIIFADPYSDVESIVDSLPNNSISAGGISCPISQDQSTLAYQNQVLPPGSALAVQLSGSIGLQTVVAQGCRPIGKQSYKITEIYKNQIIAKLNDKPALEVLEEVTSNASPEELTLLKSGLLCGIKKGGDYLSRQITGFVPSIGGIVIGTSDIKKGDTFCFQVRDAEIAQQDLKWMVDRAKAARLVCGGVPLAALQISCVARGRGLFDVPNVDIEMIRGMLPSPVIGGFFANGEIGPVGISSGLEDGMSYVHGFTTIVAVICDKSDAGLAVEDDDEFLDAWG